MVSTKKAYVHEVLGQRIVNGSYDANKALPCEGKLCDEFKMSRNVIREALSSLEAKKIIKSIPYQGTYVLPSENWNYLDSDVLNWSLNTDNNSHILASLCEIRNVFGPMISRWAAKRATAKDLSNIEKHLTDMASNRKNPIVFNKLDILFH